MSSMVTNGQKSCDCTAEIRLNDYHQMHCVDCGALVPQYDDDQVTVILIIKDLLWRLADEHLHHVEAAMALRLLEASRRKRA